MDGVEGSGMEHRSDRRGRAPGLALGLLLIVGGAALLVAQFLGFDVRTELAAFGWPIFVIGAGLLLLVVGLATGDDAGVGLSIAGSIVTTVGLILSYQSATGHWASWAYAWALIPAAVGAGMIAWGTLHLRAKIVRDGLGGLATGLVLLLVFFGFFEGIVGVGGDNPLRPLARTALPIVLIVAGVAIIVARLGPWRHRREREPDYSAGDERSGVERPTD
ncbi:hypothetical protein BH23CHL7_BH23CHL7_24690 [soil metagenome]